jgi:hypothetical protein
MGSCGPKPPQRGSLSKIEINECPVGKQRGTKCMESLYEGPLYLLHTAQNERVIIHFATSVI